MLYLSMQISILASSALTLFVNEKQQKAHTLRRVNVVGPSKAPKVRHKEEVEEKLHGGRCSALSELR